jgi:hypothetical protein
MTKYILPTILSVALIGTTAIHYWTKLAIAKVALSLDPSASVERNCASYAKGSVAWLASRPGIQEGSTVSMFLMGLDAVNTQASLAFDQAIPVPSDVVIGGKPEEYRASMGDLEHEIEHQCETARAGRNSPIYEMVRQTIEHLRSQGCKANGRCFVLLKSDMDDDAQQQLRALRTGSPLPADLAGSLDNAGIDVEICGTSEVAPRRTASSMSVTERVHLWKQMFTHAELVSTRPSCS